MSKKNENTEEKNINGEENTSANGTPDEGENTPNDEQQVLVGFTMEEVDQMKADLAAAQAEAKKSHDGWQRALADFANLKRRNEREAAQTHANLVGKVAKQFLDVVDDLELALANRPAEGEGAAWAVGIELIHKKALGALENQGVSRMVTEGQLFDPVYHEAISQEDSPDHESGQIIDVLKPGYMIGETVLRPALVRIAA